MHEAVASFRDVSSPLKLRLDACEQRFYRDLYESVDNEAAAALDIEVARFGPVQCAVFGVVGTMRMLNVVLGAAEPGAVADGHLAAAIEWIDGRGVSYYAPVTPGLKDSAGATQWMLESGLVEGYPLVKFTREPEPWSGQAPDGVELRELHRGEGEPLGRIVAAGFGLPESAGALAAQLPGRDGWRCYAAVIDDEPVACAAMLIHGDIAQFGLAATLEQARGRGCQGALIRRRLADAHDAGCDVALVETGAVTDGNPGPSYRNILRHGFVERYLRPNFTRPA